MSANRHTSGELAQQTPHAFTYPPGALAFFCNTMAGTCCRPGRRPSAFAALSATACATLLGRTRHSPVCKRN
ncbi:hypothetical protein CNECB9_2780017 [Cupriavidus necator]|uniref:Uncharacterized protein n=1 Tax=Cupriavidus necator TaxID=106590 RepID=A0A1K0IG07_CUPNE|nr:hypothetical protein CNECB9_2780017 [Cupriavidus necator]